MRANVAGMRGISGIERANIDAETEKPFEQPLAMLPPVAFGDTEAHLEQGDDRHPDFGACP